jgi:hypothetical protein
MTDGINSSFETLMIAGEIDAISEDSGDQLVREKIGANCPRRAYDVAAHFCLPESRSECDIMTSKTIAQPNPGFLGASLLLFPNGRIIGRNYRPVKSMPPALLFFIAL